MRQHVFLSRHLPHSLAHRVAQLAVELSLHLADRLLLPDYVPTSRTLQDASPTEPSSWLCPTGSHLRPIPAVGLCPHQSCPQPLTTSMIAGRGYAPLIMLRPPPPSYWACDIRCTCRSATIDLPVGKQLTIGPAQFVEPDSASRCLPSPLSLRRRSSASTRLRLHHRSSPSLSPLVTAHERRLKTVS